MVGLEATLLSSLLYRVEDAFHRCPSTGCGGQRWARVVVGSGGLIDARVLGAGYANIQALLDGSLSMRVVVALLVVKAIVWLVALGSGTSGGVLAPLLILGGALGALLGQFLPGRVGFWADGRNGGHDERCHARATHRRAVRRRAHRSFRRAYPRRSLRRYGAYAISVLIMRRSILTEKIARRGRHILQEYTVDPLDFLQAGELMTADPATLPGNMLIHDVVEFFAETATHRSYPVVDGYGRLQGLVSRSDALRWQIEDNLREFRWPRLSPIPHSPLRFGMGRSAKLPIKWSRPASGGSRSSTTRAIRS